MEPRGSGSLSLGFTFSFPAYQNGINSGILLRWTKGFDIPDTIGEDVCKLLQREIDYLRLPVKVAALVNDAAGTIMARAYTIPVSQARTSIDAIFGTGTNCVYLEKLSKITKEIDGEYDKSTSEMFISIEWGSFDNTLTVLPNTWYDVELNAASFNQGDQMFEKRVSGMFLGELLRRAVFDLYNNPAIKLFRSQSPDGNHTVLSPEYPLYTPWSVNSSILSVAESDNTDDLLLLKSKIETSLRIPATDIGIDDVKAVKLIANAIGRRAARLAGMALGAVVLQSQRLDSIQDDGSEDGVVDIGVDGSVIQFYPGFESYIRDALRAIDGIGTAGEKRIRIRIAKDGSSVGAALIAFLAAQQARCCT